MNCTNSPILRLHLSSLWLFFGGIVIVYFAKATETPAIYSVVFVVFIGASILQIASILSLDRKTAFILISVAVATFAGDVVSTLVAVNFDYATFVELEANQVLVLVIDPKHVLHSFAAMGAIKLFGHFWIFSLPAAWLVVRTDSTVCYSAIARMSFRKYCRYSRTFRVFADSFRALIGQPVEDSLELQLQILVGARILVYAWGAIFTLVTVSNFLAFFSMQLSSDPLQIAHRIIFVTLIVVFLASDTLGFFVCRSYIRKTLQSPNPNANVSKETATT